MQIKKFLFVSSLLAIILLASCTGDNIDETLELESPVDVEEIVISGEQNALFKKNVESNKTGIENNCYTITFPLSIVDNRNEIYEFNDEEQFLDFILSGLPDSVYIVDFIYPVTLESISDQSLIEVQDQGALNELTVGCAPESGWSDDEFPAYLINLDNSCYELVYPLELKDASTGELESFVTEAEFIEETIENLYFFSFPLTLRGAEQDVTVNSTDELWEALYLCEGIEKPFESIGSGVECFPVKYPLRISVQNEVITVASEDEFNNIALTYDEYEILFPLTLALDQEEVVVSNDTEFILALFPCFIEDIDPVTTSFFFFSMGADLETESSLELKCFDVSFPISILQTNDDGTMTAVEIISFEDLLLNRPDLFGQEFLYPITVKLIETGEEVILNDLDELIALFLTCIDFLRG